MLNDSINIVIVAGEASGDTLGAGLIQQLKMQYPQVNIVGIAGSKMQAAGCKAWFCSDDLAVMGLVEVLRHLPKILSIRTNLLKKIFQFKPDLYIGIDAPDFNLPIEKKLHQQGIKTIHYVSPSIWAWRQGRIKGIIQAVDLMLVFLPFEKAFYDQANLACQFVGHPMADAIPLHIDCHSLYAKLQLLSTDQHLLLLPGSRLTEIELLAPEFLRTAQILQQRYPQLKIITVLANEMGKIKFMQIKQQVTPELDIIVASVDKLRDYLAIATVTLVASGTATLETMLCKSPMVVAYKVNKFTYWLAKKLVKTEYISLPNLLAQAPLVAEMIQYDCTPELLVAQLDIYLQTTPQAEQRITALKNKFTELHKMIKRNANQQAALAVQKVLTQDV